MGWAGGLVVAKVQTIFNALCLVLKHLLGSICTCASQRTDVDRNRSIGKQAAYLETGEQNRLHFEEVSQLAPLRQTTATTQQKPGQ